MGFEEDVLGLRAAKEAAAAREEDDFVWLQDQVDEFGALVLDAVRILAAKGAHGFPVVEKRRGLLAGTKHVLTGETSWWAAGPYAITESGLHSCRRHRAGEGPYRGKLPGHPPAGGYLILGDRADEPGESVASGNLGAYRVGRDYRSNPPSRVLQLDYIGSEAGPGDARAWLTEIVVRLLP